jgi:hypothetical protein
MKTEELTQQRLEQKQTAGKLLSPEAREACERISAGESYWSQRAQVLLAVDEGATPAEAGNRAGLSRRQVKFWLGRFRDDYLDIFPEAELSRTQPEPARETEVSPPAVGGEAADEPMADAAEMEMKAGEAAEKPKQKKKKKKKKKKRKNTRKAKKAKGPSGRSKKKSTDPNI